jgi:hypothetical protein
MRQLSFQDAGLRQYAESGSIASDSLPALKKRLEEIASDRDHSDAKNAADVLSIIRGFAVS